jgi:long-chain fatty acid transport protein
MHTIGPSRAGRLLARAALFAACAALLAPRARASDLDQFGFGARAIAMGNAFTALATDFSGTYYNPGALGAARTLSVGAGFSYAGYDLTFHGANPQDDSATARQQPLSAFTLGLSSPLGSGELLSRIVPGIGLLLPTRQLVGADIQTGPGLPEYFLYGSRRDKVAVLPAVAVKILPLGDIDQTLCIGFGATILADLTGKFTFDLSSAPNSAVSTDLKLSWDAAPNVGIFYWPLDWLSLGVAYRGELALKADLNVAIDLTGPGSNDFPLALEAVTLYQPQQLVGGIAIDPFSWLTLSFDVTWANWSAFKDPFVTIRPVVAQIDPHFKDTVTPRVGIEIEPVQGLAFRAGYYYQPTPIPAQTGTTTLIDLDKHVISGGVGWTYWTTHDVVKREGDHAEVVTADWDPFSVDVFFQWQHLVEQTVFKADPTTSPVGASYRAGGEVFNVGIQFTFRL